MSETRIGPDDLTRWRECDLNGLFLERLGAWMLRTNAPVEAALRIVERWDGLLPTRDPELVRIIESLGR
jgi:hypothetical protein